MKDKPTEGMGEDPTWTEVQSGICVDADTDVPFAIVVPQERTCAERRAIVDMTWSVYSCWVGFDRKAHAQRGLYFQLGKANGHEWFRTGKSYKRITDKNVQRMGSRDGTGRHWSVTKRN
jgi:hypothetical protein